MKAKIEIDAIMSDKQIRRLGCQFMWGCIDACCTFFVFCVIAGVVWNYFTPLDDCDRDRWHRCDMTVLTDQKTGKQYLKAGGGLVERE